MKLSEYARKHGIHYQTAYNHFMAGQIPGAYQLESGTIVVPNGKFQIILKLTTGQLVELRKFFLGRGWTTKEEKYDFIELE